MGFPSLQLKRFLDDERGNFSIISAVLMIVVVGCAALGVDLGSLDVTAGTLRLGSFNGGTITTTVEIQNLADEPVYDYFGVQRPGRAFFLKTTAEL